MPELFADTSGWGSLVDPTQPFHNQAATIYRNARQLGQKIITTNYVLVELVALMTQRGILNALTSDHHFEQAGFARLLK